MDHDEARIDSEIVNGTFSTNAPHVRLNFFRYARHDYSTCFVATTVLVALLMGFVFGSVGAYLAFFTIWAGLNALGWLLIVGAALSIVISLALALILNLLRLKLAVTFQNALLTPGIVISTNPLEYVALANMSTGLGGDRYAVKRMELRSLPGHSTAIGTRFPCVSSFRDGDRPEVWGNFNPKPLCLATGDQIVLESRTAKIGADDFAMLEACITNGAIPKKAGELLFLDTEHA